MHYDDKSGVLVLDGNDYLSIDNIERSLVELDDGAGSGKGKNSSVFLALDPDREEPDYVVKFCNYHDKLTGSIPEKKRIRFDREIRALKMALEHHKDAFLLNIIDHGTELVDKLAFKYYVMEHADCDLAEYLPKENLTLQQKVVLCDQLRKALEALHLLEIYHRDLKPDNIFFVEGQCKIGDLGFIAFRNDDYDIDGKQERIGPTGLMSPEAINKNLANFSHPDFECDYMIDDKSDVFQLGKLFWYIFQGNFPTGQILLDDFVINDSDIFNNIIFPMLQYAKSRRPNIAELNSNFKPIRRKFVV